MEQLFASCLSFLSVSCVVGVFGSIFGITLEGNSKRKRLDMFNSIELCMSYVEVCKIIGETGLLVSERNLSSSKCNQSTYIWYLGWHTSSKGATVSNHTIYHNSTLSHSSGKGNVSTNNKERTYIKVVFENDRVVIKEQSGLGL